MPSISSNVNFWSNVLQAWREAPPRLAPSVKRTPPTTPAPESAPEAAFAVARSDGQADKAGWVRVALQPAGFVAPPQPVAQTPAKIMARAAYTLVADASTGAGDMVGVVREA